MVTVVACGRVSPVSGVNTGSIFTFVWHSSSNLAVKSRSSFRLRLINPPFGHERAWSILKVLPHTQWDGRFRSCMLDLRVPSLLLCIDHADDLLLCLLDVWVIHRILFFNIGDHPGNHLEWIGILNRASFLGFEYAQTAKFCWKREQASFHITAAIPV